MLISVHLAKTAGTSFAAALESHFKQRLLRDYGDYPIDTPRLKRNAMAVLNNSKVLLNGLEHVDCIHGHFLPVKYWGLARRRPATFVTWMREPVERLVSFYHFWRRNYDPTGGKALPNRVVEENWSLERFCLAPELRNYYSQFLWRFPFERFAFVGITECFEEDLDYFGRTFLGVRLPPLRENANPSQTGERYELDPEFRRRVEKYHAQDLQLYLQALARRNARTF